MILYKLPEFLTSTLEKENNSNKMLKEGFYFLTLHKEKTKANTLPLSKKNCNEAQGIVIPQICLLFRKVPRRMQ